MRGDLHQLLDADPGQAQNVHGSPCPERVFLLVEQVVSSAGGSAVITFPDQPPRRVSCCPSAAKLCPGWAARAAASSCAVASRRRSTVATSTGRTGRRSRVRASMRALRWRLTLRCSTSRPIGQGATHCTQRAGLLERPLREVEIERPDFDQALAVGDPGYRLAAGLLAGTWAGRLLVQQPLPPRGGDLWRQAQRVDARMVDFKILPESLGQVVGQVFQAVVVQAGLALTQVGDH